ncbi:MAG: hypothetical protein L0Y76_03900, partial [Ignavibacteria bacterium]|nr:hypothetical protein [Ignavibacteria bacterium]
VHCIHYFTLSCFEITNYLLLNIYLSLEIIFLNKITLNLHKLILNKNSFRIAVTVCILFALTLLTNDWLVHLHEDGASHQECQLCTIISFAGAAIMTSLFQAFFIRKSIIKINPLQNSSILQNYFKLNYPDRAPPQNI